MGGWCLMVANILIQSYLVFLFNEKKFIKFRVYFFSSDNLP